MFQPRFNFIALLFSVFPFWMMAQSSDLAFKNKFQNKFSKNRPDQNNQIQTNLYKPGKSLNYFWNAFDWQYTGNSTMTYTPEGRISVQIDSGFIYRKTSYTYDEFQRETEKLEQNYNAQSMQWENDRREVNIFDGQGELLSESRSEQWSGTNWTVLYGEKHIRSYSPQNLLLEDLQKNWNATDTVWENDYLETEYLYDGQSRLLSYVSKNWIDTVWENEEKSLWSYGPDNKPSQVIIQEWNGLSFVDSIRITDISWNFWNGNLAQSEPSQYTMQKLIGGNWTNSVRITITGDQNGSQTFLNELFLDGNWIPFSRFRNIFDEQLNPVVNISETYNPATLAFDTVFCTSFQNSYDGQGKILEQIVFNWDADLQQLDPVSRRVFSEHQIFTVHPETQTVACVLFPNPVRSGISIQTGSVRAAVTMHDVQGRLVLSGETDGSGNLSTAGIKGGIYQVVIRNAHGVISKGRLLIE